MAQKINLPMPVVISMLLGFGLSMYGNHWGLPARFHSDEMVTNALHMAGSLSLVDSISDFVQLTGYQLFLVVCFALLYLIFRVTDFPIAELKSAASISWFEMSNQFPEFATGIYIYARIISAALGMLTIYFVYRLTEKIYGKIAGIYSSFTLAFCMGFIGFNHLAKSQSLLNLISVLVLLCMIIVLQSQSKRSSTQLYFLASCLAGYATSVHLEGPFLILPLGITFLISPNRKISWLYGGGLCFILGVLLGTPSLVTHFSSYFRMYPDRFETQLIHPPKSNIAFWISPANHFLELCALYGIPLFFLIVSGLFKSLCGLIKFKKEEFLLLSYIIVYFVLITLFFESKYPEAKHIILIIPPLAIFGGKFISDFLENSNSFKMIRYAFISIIFIYSFIYCVKSLSVFTKDDTRYYSTQWILSHILPNSKIEIFDQIHYVASPQIMNHYDIIYMGRSSKNFTGKRFFKWNTIQNSEEYMRQLNFYDSRADYILVDLNNKKELDLTNEEVIRGRRAYLKALFSGKKQYKLIQVFQTRNPKVSSTRWEGLVYYKNLFLEPNPMYDATANTIYIFKRIKG